ncbi:MFS transporter [Catellatospora tritici]|uniref:MFS transporter n=1 Tax=Catellatospora tritici TaxID=2851566 RepID=UPI001C2D2E8F|nr:MFS transporter [Catellatospora tritici]MBV1851692.1 MFS transporter [Catellatospora tritici]
METVLEAPRAGRREWIGLAVLALPNLLVSIDVFVMLLALPHLSRALGASSSQQLWIMDGYGFLLSGFLITMGTLGDRIGRRRLLLLGAAGFGVASVLAAYAPNTISLIAARMLLGIAGATLAPSMLALISNMFRDARQRGLAIGIWFACFMGGTAIGPVVGGLMLEHFWWGSVFLLGVPIMLVLLAVGPFLLPEYRDPGAGRLDPASVALSLAAILPIVYGLKELARGGARPGPALAVAAGLAFGVLFVRRQQRLEHPLLHLALFRGRAFSTALSSMFFGTMLMGALMMFITTHLQLVQGLPAGRAGLWLLPAVLGGLVSVLVAPLLARRLRPAYLIGGGIAVSVCGLLLLTRVGTGSAPWLIATGFALTNLGAGPFITLGTGLVIGAAPPERAGAAAALNETSGEFGFALGVALLGSLGTAIYRGLLGADLPTGLPAEAAAGVRDSLAGAVAQAARLPEPVADQVLGAARTAFTTGMHAAALVSATVLAIVAVVIVRALRHVPPTPAP